VGLDQHLARLYGPAGALRIQPACTQNKLRQSIDSLLLEYRPQEARIRVTLDRADGRLFVAIQVLALPPSEVYEKGVCVVTTKARRQTPTIKKTDFIAQSRTERLSLVKSTAYEGLIVHAGRILEGLTSNFFYVQGHVLGTASRGVLRGVTRGEILRLAREELVLDLRYRAISLEEIQLIQEAFISSSSRGIVPVVQVDKVRIGSGRVGDLTKRLSRAYQQSVLLRAEEIVVH
jgi:branched-chain amino acid aminotransferase